VSCLEPFSRHCDDTREEKRIRGCQCVRSRRLREGLRAEKWSAEFQTCVNQRLLGNFRSPAALKPLYSALAAFTVVASRQFTFISLPYFIVQYLLALKVLRDIRNGFTSSRAATAFLDMVRRIRRLRQLSLRQTYIALRFRSLGLKVRVTGHRGQNHVLWASLRIVEQSELQNTLPWSETSPGSACGCSSESTRPSTHPFGILHETGAAEPWRCGSQALGERCRKTDP
jgi:hypothetical protein